MADVSVAAATTPPPVIGVDKVEKRKKKSKDKEARSKTGEEKKKKKSATGEEPKRKKKSTKASGSPDSDDAHLTSNQFQEVDISTVDPVPQSAGGAETATGDQDTSEGEVKFHDLDEPEDDSESEPGADAASNATSRRMSVQSHKRDLSNGSHRSQHVHPQVEETSVRQLSSGASLNVTTLRRTPSGRAASRHSVRTSMGNRRSLGLGIDQEHADRLASVPDAAAGASEGEEHEATDHTTDPKVPPKLPSRPRIIDLDAGRVVSWRDTPAAKSTPDSDVPGEEDGHQVPDVNAYPDDFPEAIQPSNGSKSSLWSSGANRLAGVSAAVGGGASSLKSGLGRSLAAGIAAVRKPTGEDGDEPERERVRLPRREVDEDQLAEDVMRFAEARHILRTERDMETLRGLGLRLEQAWREKLSEGQTLRSQLEETQDVLGDLEDENEHLRDQLGLLSEQIASREEAFEDFQRLTAAQHKKERQLWSDEVREEKDNALTSVARLRRLLAQERATSAQLRLVIHAVKSGRLDVLDKVNLDADVPNEDADQAQSDTEEVFADPSFTPNQDTAQSQSTPQETGDGSGDLDDDVLYNLQGASNKTKQTPGAALMAQDKPMHLGAMRDAGLVDSDPLVSQDGDHANTAEGAENVSGDSQRTVAIASRVLFDKAAADAALTAALQEENTALRSYQKCKERKYRDMEIELAQYRTRLAAAEAAVDDALNT